MNPGYLPTWLKIPPLNARSEHPVNLVRVYNMRFWLANKIHNFEEFLILEDSEKEAQAQAQEDSNIEISLMNGDSDVSDPAIAMNTSEGFIEEETKATFRSTTSSST